MSPEMKRVVIAELTERTLTTHHNGSVHTAQAEPAASWPACYPSTQTVRPPRAPTSITRRQAICLG